MSLPGPSGNGGGDCWADTGHVEQSRIAVSVGSKHFAIMGNLSSGFVRIVPDLNFLRYFASGSGRTWICTASGRAPLPSSFSQGVRSPLALHRPRPFQPAFGSSMRPSRPLA